MKRIVIIGSGIAGLTCSIYLARAGVDVTVITGNEVGGNTAKAVWIENYTGFPDGISGEDLMSNAFAQAERLGVKFIFDSVVSVDIDTYIKNIVLESGNNIEADYIVLQTGTANKTLNLPMEQDLIGKGLSYCVLCDSGAYSKNSIVGVVGGGNTAIQSAIYLSSICKEVHLFVRKPALTYNQENINKLADTDNIILHYKTEVKEYLTDSDCNLIGIKDSENITHRLDGLFICIGTKPNTDFIKKLGLLDENGYIYTWSKGRVAQRVYAVGSCIKGCVNQCITSAGSGACTALGILEDLQK